MAVPNFGHSFVVRFDKKLVLAAVASALPTGFSTMLRFLKHFNTAFIGYKKAPY
jgi:hypothetical protein